MKFRVTVLEVHNQDYIVEAKNLIKAKEKVADGNGEIDEGSFSYNRTLDLNEWPEPVVA